MNLTNLEQRIADRIDEIARARMIPSTPLIMMRQLYPEEWAQIRREKEWLRERVAKMTHEEKLEFVS